MKAGVWILVALTFAAGALAQAPQERPDWKLFFSDQAVDGTIVIGRTSVLARCWLTMWNVHRNGSCRHRLLKCLMPCLRSMPERSVTSSRIRWDGVKRDFDGWNQDRPCVIHEALDGMGVSAVCP